MRYDDELKEKIVMNTFCTECVDYFSLDQTGPIEARPRTTD